MARQFIYHMAGLNKAYGNKKVLENIHLSFYPEAKIGILGPNGGGKSTVLGSWPALIPNTPVRPGSPKVRGSAISHRSRNSILRRTCSRTDGRGGYQEGRSSTATTS